MSNFRIRIGGDGPVVAEADATGWRLIVRGNIYATGVSDDDLHTLNRITGRDLEVVDTSGLVNTP
jgi:hypothetical protein